MSLIPGSLEPGHIYRFYWAVVDCIISFWNGQGFVCQVVIILRHGRASSWCDHHSGRPVWCDTNWYRWSWLGRRKYIHFFGEISWWWRVDLGSSLIKLIGPEVLSLIRGSDRLIMIVHHRMEGFQWNQRKECKRKINHFFVSLNRT